MLKAVILDTNAVARNLLTSVLNNGGHEVVGDANLAPASLARVIKLKPQIICVDIGEPDDTGMGVIDQLRKDLPKALLFMVSAKIDAPTLQAAQQRGVHGFIVKPFNSVAVLSTLRNTILRIAKQQRPAEPEPMPDSASNSGSQIAGDPA